MPERLSPEQFRNLLNERDTFKLSIRGHAALEAEMLAEIEEAFPGSMPTELQRVNFPTKLALAIALGVVPEAWKASLTVLAKLRHDFAHGDPTELPRERAKQIEQALVVGLNAGVQFERMDKGADLMLDRLPPHDTLVLALSAAWTTVTGFAQAKRAERVREAAQAAWRVQRANAEARERLAQIRKKLEELERGT